MGWSPKIGRILGIDIKVHLTFIFILVWGAYVYGGRGADPIRGLVVVLAVFGLVLLHELGHSVAAKGYGIEVKDIILLPIGGVARLERMPEKPLHELVVALAGPMVNVIIAALLLPIIFLMNFGEAQIISFQALTSPGFRDLPTFLLMTNIFLVAFNMIPAFPLDGGRVFRAFLGFFMEYPRATNIATQVGRVAAIGLGLFAIWGGQFFLAIIALFIFTAGGQENQAVAIRSKLRRLQAGQVMNQNSLALAPDATVGQIAPLVMSQTYQSNFAVLDPIDGQLLGVTSGRRVARALARGERYLGITEIMQHAPSIPRVSLNAPLDEVQEQLQRTSNRVAVVYDGLNYRGLVSLEDIYRVFQFLSRNGNGSVSHRMA